MSDGRLVSLVQRTGLLVLWISVVTCLLPNSNTGNILQEMGMDAAAAPLGEARAEAVHLTAGPTRSPAAAKQTGGAAQQTGSAAGSTASEQSEAALVKEVLEHIRTSHLEDVDPDHIEMVEVVATGYTAGKESTGKSPGHPEYGITYSGVKVRKDDFSTIAADPAIFPIGTIMYIPGYGFGVVADTGGAIKGHKIDLYFVTKQQVYEQWGKRKVKVLVLRKGSGRVTEAMMNDLNNAADAVPVEKSLDLLADLGRKE
ncbi:MAG: yuiC [Paenibacillaceae bacterium]|jgi:3D (Asp-Asp-Asp) domain-containing protein|nr:yuiC [Paenibacillaceae bacterium]